MVGTYGLNTDVVNRWFMTYSGGAPSSANATALAGSVLDSWQAALSAIHHTDFTIETAEVVDLTSSTAAAGEVTSPHAGTLTGGKLPADTCGVVSFETARRYRGGHPRVYMPVGDDTKVLDAQHWTTAFVALFQAGWESFLGDVAASVWAGGGTLTHVAVSYFTGNEVVISPTTGRARNVPERREPPLVDSVNNYVGRATFGSQRRRLRS
jgi:hypothetical protein